MSIFVTSDTHFAHDRDFLYGARGFPNITAMNKQIIENWNSIITPEDEVYHLGDVMLTDNNMGLECLEALNGKIHILTGNHDTAPRLLLYSTLANITLEGYAKVFKYNKYTFYLSHYPTLTVNPGDSKSMHQQVLNLFGHTHQVTNFYDNIPFMYHVGMDSHNCTPVLLDDIIEDIKVKISQNSKNV